MTNRLITMSQKEIDRVEIIQQVIGKRISQVEAAKQLRLTTRQVRNLQKAYERLGAKGLLSKRRGKPSNHRLKAGLKSKAIELIRTHYADFGPTLAHEKLTEQHQLSLSVETLRQEMIQSGLWQGKKKRRAQVHQQRARRSCLGELVQIDGSPHDWFEGRRDKCCLLVFVDDATSRLMWLHFAETESTEAYFTATEAYLKQHGRPLTFYSDRHSIFRVNIAEAESGTGETQFGRAMRELGIELICANSPQAKGRVEKANGTLQDRLTKEMRLKGISSIRAANAFLPDFIADYNRRFAVSPANSQDAHRTAIPDEATCALIFSQQHVRKISKNLEVSYDNIIYQIQTDAPSYTMRGASLTVCDSQGEITLLYKQQSLAYKRYDKEDAPAKIVSIKELNAPKQIKRPKPKADHPWRNYPQIVKQQVQAS